MKLYDALISTFTETDIGDIKKEIKQMIIDNFEAQLQEGFIFDSHELTGLADEILAEAKKEVKNEVIAKVTAKALKQINIEV